MLRYRRYISSKLIRWSVQETCIRSTNATATITNLAYNSMQCGTDIGRPLILRSLHNAQPISYSGNFVPPPRTNLHPHPRRNYHSTTIIYDKSTDASISSLSSMDGYYDSHSSSAQTKTHASFKDIPVHASILSHIESLGLGIRPKKKKKIQKLQRSSQKGGRITRKKRGIDDGLLSAKEEKAYFQQQRDEASRRRSVRMKEKMKLDGKRRKSLVNDSEGDEKTLSWLPPPPFSVSTATANPTENMNDQTLHGHKIIRLPVKVLGSSGSLEEELPRSSKGLPEVALAGRSNVGKSTLLNALLYGNQLEKPQERQFRRGKTPDSAKLPKGVKAVMSDKPGETRRITLYQLSSNIIIPPKDRQGTNKKKISLLLADLPGYGFAFASEEKYKEWQDLMQHYLLDRGKSLKRVLLLIDARHGMKNSDFDFLSSLQESLKPTSKDGSALKHMRRDLPPIQIVLTKCDLVTQDDLARRVVQVRQQLSDCLVREPSSLPVMLVSARAGLGFNNIRGGIARGGVLELQRELAALVPHSLAQKR